MAVRCSVTASQASFSNVIGEPGHTKPQAAILRHGVSYCDLYWVYGSQYIDRRAASVP
jgi:hypothetical protein